MIDEAKRDRGQRHDQMRRAQKPWRKWYNLPLWKTIRRDQLERQPLCERHLKRNEVVAATVVHHVHQHNGSWALFIQGPFESVCKGCHDGEIQQEEAAGCSMQIGDDGWPVDPRHRANRGQTPAR